MRAVVAAAAAAALLLALATLLSLRPLPDSLRLDDRAATRIQVLDRDGRPLAPAFDGGWNLHQRLPLAEVPGLLRDAFVTAEDRRFWTHGGVDWRARLSALRVNLRAGRSLRGASTISEQVVRILQPRPRTLWSRWLEGITARRLEVRFAKADILEFYLNQVPYGANRRGIAPAAQYYFGRSVETLTAQEMLALAVLVRAPSRLAADPPALQRRVQRLAQALREQAPWTQLAVSDAPLLLVRARPTLAAAHFVAHAERSDCAAQEALRHPALLRSSLDARLQADTEAFLRERLRDLARDGARQGAALIVDLDGNRVRAYASADLEHPEVVGIDPLQTPRQPGSALKPLLYAQAIERGWQAGTLIRDETLRAAVGSGLHEYRNYSRTHYGEVTVAEALGNSLNIPAVKALQFVGQQAFLQRLRALGVSSLTQNAETYGDGLALGNGALSLYELVQAYSALAREGLWQPLTVCEMQTQRPPPQRPIAADAARSISAILSDPAARLLEFGEGGVLRFPVRTAVKTGTSSDYRDAWTLAYNGRWLVGVWFGNLSGAATEGVTGARGPALLTRSLLARLPADRALRSAAVETAAPTPAAADALPEQPQLAQPFTGLLLARDPRIPDALEAFEFVAAWRQTTRQVDWELDGAVIARTREPRYVWSVSAGEHVLRAVLTSVEGLTVATPAVRFTVR